MAKGDSSAQPNAKMTFAVSLSRASSENKDIHVESAYCGGNRATLETHTRADLCQNTAVPLGYGGTLLMGRTEARKPLRLPRRT